MDRMIHMGLVFCLHYGSEIQMVMVQFCQQCYHWERRGTVQDSPFQVHLCHASCEWMILFVAFFFLGGGVGRVHSWSGIWWRWGASLCNKSDGFKQMLLLFQCFKCFPCTAPRMSDDTIDRVLRVLPICVHDVM